MSLLGSVWSATVGPIVNGVTDVLGMSGSAHYQRRNMREAAALQHEENKYWAEYNTPANQMARLKAAGLNPNLVYGNGADAQFQGSVSPSGGMPHLRGGYGTDFITHLNMLEQNKNLRAQNELLRSQTAKTENESAGIALDNLRKQGMNPFQYGSYEAMEQHYKALNAKSENEKIASAIALSKAELFGKEIENRFSNAASYIKLDQLSLERSIAAINASMLPSILENQVKLSQVQQGQAYAQIVELGALTALQRELSLKARQETLTEKEKTDLTSADKEIRQRKAKLASLGLDPDANNIASSIINAVIGIYQNRQNW